MPHDGCEDPCCLALNIIQDSTTCISACSTAPRQERLDADLDAELRSHVQLLMEENIRRGMTLDEARKAGRREFGGVEQVRESYREQRGLPFLDTMWQDLRFAFRPA